LGLVTESTEHANDDLGRRDAGIRPEVAENFSARYVFDPAQD
jgi:hypothetical protein